MAEDSQEIESYQLMDRLHTITTESGSYMNWQVYIILCSDNSLYTGITTDIDRRFRQHVDGAGAKYFRGRHPVKVVHIESGHTRSSASKRELAIKGLSHAGKIAMMSSITSEIGKPAVAKTAATAPTKAKDKY